MNPLKVSYHINCMHSAGGVVGLVIRACMLDSADQPEYAAHSWLFSRLTHVPCRASPNLPMLMIQTKMQMTAMTCKRPYERSLLGAAGTCVP